MALATDPVVRRHPSRDRRRSLRVNGRSVDAALERHAWRPAFKAFGQTLNYADVDRLSRSFASYLQNRLGVRQGDRVAVMMPNLLAFPSRCARASSRRRGAGECESVVHAARTEHQLNDAGVETIVVSTVRRRRWPRCAPIPA